MAAQVIDGKAVAARVRAEVAQGVEAFVAERGRPPGLATVLIGDDPGLQDLILGLAQPGPLRDEVAAKYPTAALATLAADVVSWPDLRPGGAQLVAFVRPRDLG